MSLYDPLAIDENFVEKPKPKAPNQFQSLARNIYNPLGFKKAYNFIFFFITTGALLGFSLASLRKIDVNGYWIKNDATPSDAYYFQRSRYNIGIQIHLACRYRI